MAIATSTYIGINTTAQRALKLAEYLPPASNGITKLPQLLRCASLAPERIIDQEENAPLQVQAKLPRWAEWQRRAYDRALTRWEQKVIHGGFARAWASLVHVVGGPRKILTAGAPLTPETAAELICRHLDVANRKAGLYSSLFERLLKEFYFFPHSTAIHSETITAFLTEMAHWTAGDCPLFGLLDFPLKRHTILDIHGLDADAHLATCTRQLAGYRRLFGVELGLKIFNGEGFLSLPLQNAQGKKSNFTVVIERARHEADRGLRFCLHEAAEPYAVGDPADGLHINTLGEVQIRFGENDSVEVVNIQGANSRKLAVLADRLESFSFDRYAVFADVQKNQVDGAVALYSHRRRFAALAAGVSPLDFLVACVIDFARVAGAQSVLGIRERAQRAHMDAVRMGKRQPGLYDLLFKRFDFVRPGEDDDFWWLPLPDNLPAYYATVLPRPANVRPQKWPGIAADASDPRVQAYVKATAELPTLLQNPGAYYYDDDRPPNYVGD